VNLGWCDVCLRVSKANISTKFYGDLGFWRVEGSEEEGWAVMTNGNMRLGLFEPQFMESEFSLNFRGGDIKAISEELKAKGHSFAKEPKITDRGGSALMTDPDGHTIFFDSMIGETKKVEPMD
jgi:lactoylglutathione lyase